MSKSPLRDAATGIAVHRAARLYRLVTLLGEKAKPRETLLKKLKLDLRGFYRDIEFLRELEIDITARDGSYILSTTLDEALGRLPFPDPCLSVSDAIHLLNGSSAARKKLRKKLEAITGPGV